MERVQLIFIRSNQRETKDKRLNWKFPILNGFFLQKENDFGAGCTLTLLSVEKFQKLRKRFVKKLSEY